MPTADQDVRRSEFDDWVHAHTCDLLRYAKAHVREGAVAEDLVQLAFIAAWEGRGKFQQRSSPRTWLFSILKKKIADHWRKAYRDPVIHGVEPVDEDFFQENGAWAQGHVPDDRGHDGPEQRERILRFLAECLEKLPDHWRAVVEMKFLKEKDAGAICQGLGISPTNYWQQIHRAKVRLHDCVNTKMKKGIRH